MQLFHKLNDMNRLIFKFIRKDHMISQNNYEVTSQQFIKTLDNTYNILENTYYNNIIYPQLQNIWKIEQENLILCVTCIMHTIMSYHAKYSQIHV
jgi:hypothetical protein